MPDVKDVEELLKKCKFATCSEIACKLGLSNYTCRVYLWQLRRTNPHVSAVKGKGYYYDDQSKLEDTGMTEEVIKRIEATHKYIKREKSVNISDIAAYTGVGVYTVRGDLRYLKSIDPNIRTYVNRGGGIYYVTDEQWSPAAEWHFTIMSCLSIDKPVDKYYIGEKLGKNPYTVKSHLRQMIDDGFVVRTKSNSYLRKSEYPCDKLTDDMVRVLFYLKEHKKATRLELNSVLSYAEINYVNRGLRVLISVCPNISIDKSRKTWIYKWTD